MPDAPSAPDIFSDLFQTHISPVGVTVVFALTDPVAAVTGKEVNKPVGTYRTSLENWKLILMSGRKQLKDLEAKGSFSVPLSQQLLDHLKLTPQDW